MTEPHMFKSKGNGIDMQLAQWGSGGECILCVHGMTANCRCWDRLAPALSKRHRVLGMDLRGRGLSDKPTSGYSLEHHVQDLHDLVAALGLTRVTLLGHSLGAYISVAFSSLYPDKVAKLILLDGGGQLSQQRWDNIERVIKPSLERLEQVFPSFEAYTEPLKNAPIFQPWTVFHERYFQYDIKNIDQGVRSRIDPVHIRQEIDDIRNKNFAAYYRDIACDVLILRATQGFLGDDDLLLPLHVVTDMLNAIPGSRDVAVERTNHFSILFDQHAARDKALSSFLH
jgi:pimeloyl-ACP methyl ester carboxylesterase